MDESILFTLLHDVWGEGAEASLHLVMSKLSPAALCEADAKTLHHLLPEIALEKWRDWCAYYSPQRYDLRAELLERQGIGVLLCTSAAYPEALTQIDKPPSLLYIKGKLELARLNIGIVGSRRATPYGKNVAFSLAKGLSNEGVCIVSGLAKGIDASAHKGAIEGPGGTIAVLGCGIDRIYPRENARLYDEVLAHPRGAILSEWPLGAGAVAWHFPARNRIIAGLADGIVVVEAAKKSGSLISASYALDYGKEVFAVPGLVTSPQSVGCHRLIKDGAKLVAQVGDVLEEFGQQTLFKEAAQQTPTRAFSPEQKKVYDALSSVPQSVEEISLLCGLPVHTVNGVLLEFEIDDIVLQDYGRRYAKIDQ